MAMMNQNYQAEKLLKRLQNNPSIIELLIPKHMCRHQVCDCNCQLELTKRDFQISMAVILKWPETVNPSHFFLWDRLLLLGKI